VTNRHADHATSPAAICRIQLDLRCGLIVGLTTIMIVGGVAYRGIVVGGVRRMNEVNARRARLVLGWVTVSGRAGVPSRYTVYNQPTR